MIAIRGMSLPFFEKMLDSSSNETDVSRPSSRTLRVQAVDMTPACGGEKRRGELMNDATIHGSIEQLVAEEHELWQRESDGTASDADQTRLQELRVSLDQCWDLLRQRRALREAGRDPDDAGVRPPDTVEHYQQ